ncbi:hypothetical protein [Desulfotomaculum nigrificans]|uniref:hypothetical protein n=1 Tax=Desulfotomaculum nigrificans TaxID=1565 RepID=UPI0001FAE76F|nr:hypothetical protein [Desulfotomaculum nigrificans]MDA8235915.1 hypothetical protein [Clostridia bacterium]
MKWTRESIFLILAVGLVIISGILPLTNIFASSYYEVPSEVVMEVYEESQPVEKNLPPSTNSTKESKQTDGTFKQTGPRTEEIESTAPPATQQPDRNLPEPGQSAEESNTTQQPAQKRPQSYPGDITPGFTKWTPIIIRITSGMIIEATG